MWAAFTGKPTLPDQEQWRNVEQPGRPGRDRTASCARESAVPRSKSGTRARGRSTLQPTTRIKGSCFLFKAIRAKSIDFIKEAIRLDPGHADSHAGLAQALSHAAIYRIDPRPPKVALPAAPEYGHHAILILDGKRIAQETARRRWARYEWTRIEKPEDREKARFKSAEDELAEKE